ncbi:hypothetical protein WJX73_004009 [Symbiochloris irregularis]|uniref:Uncharacterized protein n=1 Tax=Symbiochloris irregularis TaxID=706552 RepID=A0AAW1NPJ5_9CHLO
MELSDLARLPQLDRLPPVVGLITALGIFFASLILGWYILWRAWLRHMPICQELMGLRKRSPADKLALEAKIQKIKRQNSRGRVVAAKR